MADDDISIDFGSEGGEDGFFGSDLEFSDLEQDGSDVLPDDVASDPPTVVVTVSQEEKVDQVLRDNLQDVSDAMVFTPAGPSREGQSHPAHLSAGGVSFNDQYAIHSIFIHASTFNCPRFNFEHYFRCWNAWNNA